MKNKLTIFYTDDDQEDLEFFREVVDTISTGITVVTQNNGPELLHALNNPPPTPHMVFLDINMPGMTGLETLKKVRESRSLTELPVIMFSTSSDEQTIEKSRELGANYYVSKPGAFDQFKKSIEHALKINWAGFMPSKKDFVYSYS